MAFCGIGFSYGLEGMDLLSPSVNSSKRLHFFDSQQQQQQRLLRRRSPLLPRVKQQSRGIRCLASELKESHKHVASEEDCEEDLRHVLKFRMSDFVICNSVSIGLGGRGDELVFEAMVRNVECPLHNKRVVLRKFTSTQAQRRGRRSVQVLKKLARRKLLYHSYSMQVHGYVDPSSGTDQNSFTLVHGYHGSYSLRHWLQLSNWLPTLEATLALDEERVRKVGDDTVGGPAVSRLLRIIRVLMRDLLIGVNYLHSHGLAHTELKLENVHISPLDHHIKVGILGNASDFIDNSPNNGTLENNMDRRQMMIAFDMRCVGFMMAKMVLRELMDPLVFMKFKTFLTKGNDASCLREFLLPILSANSPSGNAGLQILDRNWGAGWNLLSLLLATKTSSKKISCLDALRHPFLCGPRWKVDPSMDLIRWGLGSTAVRITEEYIYGIHQRSRLAHFIELMETLNPFQRPKNWLKLLPGKWRLLYSTGRHLGLTFRQPSERVLINDAHLSVTRANDTNTNLVFTSDVNFKVMIGSNWPHDKMGSMGNLQISSLFRLTAGRRQYLREENNQGTLSNSRGLVSNRPSRKWRTASQIKGPPLSLPVAKLTSGEIDVTMQLYDSSLQEVSVAQNVIREVRTQVPPEMFDVSKLVCGTYVDSRLLVLRGVNGSALLFTRARR